MEIHTGVHQLIVNCKLPFPLCVDSGDHAPVSSRHSDKGAIYGKMLFLCPPRTFFCAGFLT